MSKHYGYVGPTKLADRASPSTVGTPIESAADLAAWARRAGPAIGRVTATFVVDTQGCLRLADRHSEHVACAGGQAVLAAGEMVLAVHPGDVVIEEVSNQSTGYCPEPESWPAVAAVLEKAGIRAPGDYTAKFLFRRCLQCGQINIVKDAVFECAVWGSALPLAWNLESAGKGDGPFAVG